MSVLTPAYLAEIFQGLAAATPPDQRALLEALDHAIEGLAAFPPDATTHGDREHVGFRDFFIKSTHAIAMAFGGSIARQALAMLAGQAFREDLPEQVEFSAGGPAYSRNAFYRELTEETLPAGGTNPVRAFVPGRARQVAADLAVDLEDFGFDPAQFGRERVTTAPPEPVKRIGPHGERWLADRREQLFTERPRLAHLAPPAPEAEAPVNPKILSSR